MLWNYCCLIVLKKMSDLIVNNAFDNLDEFATTITVYNILITIVSLSLSSLRSHKWMALTNITFYLTVCTECSASIHLLHKQKNHLTFVYKWSSEYLGSFFIFSRVLLPTSYRMLTIVIVFILHAVAYVRITFALAFLFFIVDFLLLYIVGFCFLFFLAKKQRERACLFIIQ